MSFLKDGVVSIEELKVPGKDRRQKEPYIVIECLQKIPCNPCVDSCPQHAITMHPTINDLPEVDYDLCTGCGICVTNCPGLAIFLIDQTFEDNRSLLGLPWEFFPLPEKGELVTLLDRAGNPCGKGEVIRIRNSRAQDRTPLVFLAVDHDLVMVARNFRKIQND